MLQLAELGNKSNNQYYQRKLFGNVKGYIPLHTFTLLTILPPHWKRSSSYAIDIIIAKYTDLEKKIVGLHLNLMALYNMINSYQVNWPMYPASATKSIICQSVRCGNRFNRHLSPRRGALMLWAIHLKIWRLFKCEDSKCPQTFRIILSRMKNVIKSYRSKNDTVAYTSLLLVRV